MSHEKNLDAIAQQIGEISQHSINGDKKIVETSNWYFGLIQSVLDRQKSILKRKPLRFLEIASYRHIIGYMMSQKYGAEATIFDLSKNDLESARLMALDSKYDDNVTLVTGDFHSLPFEDAYFDFVFISASIHHSRTPERIINEAMRVLSADGLFYSQREPCKRLFCYYGFLANRPSDYTPFEKHLHQREMMRIFSSPFPGARNALVFGRVENDLIPLQFYYDTYAMHGEIKEQVLYHDGLLTKLDKEILTLAETAKEPQLAAFIEKRLNEETAQALPLLGTKERLLSFKLPTDAENREMSLKVSKALKMRPANKDSVAWKRAMAEIFGASLRFVVERKRMQSGAQNTLKWFPFKGNRRSIGIGERSDKKFKCDLRKIGNVYDDPMLSKQYGLELWNPLLPDIQTSSQEKLRAVFAVDDWDYFDPGNGFITMRNRTSPARLNLLGHEFPAALIIRYRPLLNDAELARVTFRCGSEVVIEELVAQAEDRLAKFMCDSQTQTVSITILLTTLDGQPITRADSLAVSVLQLIPVVKK